MPEIILHHYALSPHAEKIRLLFGLKNLKWRSVEVPVMMPRPLLSTVLGGFRRIPVMQIGADFYCDTSLICDEIEKRFPSPSLYPSDRRGMVKAVCWWLEKSTFLDAVCLTFGGMVGRVPAALIEERSRFFGIDLEPVRLALDRTIYLQRLNAHMHLLAQILFDGRRYIFGEQLSAADFAAYHPIWFIRQNVGPEITDLLPGAASSSWYDRITAVGYGVALPLKPEHALAVATSVLPEHVEEPSCAADDIGLSRGDVVRISANDYGTDPVVGRLLSWTDGKFVLQRDVEDVGSVNLHFPRPGYDVRRVTGVS